MVDREGIPGERFSPAAWLATALAIVIVFTATWFPADSVEVERGEALWILPLSLATLGMTLIAVEHLFLASSVNWLRRLDRVDFVAIAIVLWMGFAALSVKGVGDFRAAVNEWWWWVAAGSFWIASRRIGGMASFRNRGIALVIGLTVAQATLAAHQYLISLPADRERFLADPDRHLAAYGIVAPEGSAERELFVARLFEGGPTGSFALANSLAGYLVLGLILALGVLWVRRRERIAWLLMVAIGFVGLVLWWTQSRSAMLALGVGIGWSLGVPWIAKRVSQPVLVGAGVFGLICALGLSFFLATCSSVWALFPRSLAFRFQYWQSTLAISNQHPWVGIGPGNFQDTYPSFRLDEASEGIADPHHWFMETLAAGGWPAALLLLVLLGLCIQRRVASARWRFQSPFQHEESVEWKSIEVPLRWTALVACLVGAVWAVQYWIASEAIPDPDGLFLGTVAGGFSGWGIWRLISREVLDTANKNAENKTAANKNAANTIEQAPKRTVGFFATSWPTGAVVAVLVHWMAAGGWTIPGNAIPWLLVSGMLVPSVLGPNVLEGAVEKCSAPSAAKTRRSNALMKGQSSMLSRLGIAVSLLAISGLWHVTAQSKVTEARRLQANAVQLLERGQWVDGTDAFAMAAQADPWDPKLSLREAEAWHWRLLRSGDTDAVRAGWSGAIAEATRRNGRAYQVHEVSGGQAMVLYQCYGKPSDLQLAKEAYTQVVNLAPGEIRSVAQLVVLARVQGDRSQSDALKERLEYLSGTGGHSVRELSKVMVWAVEYLGEAAARVGGVKRSVEAEIERLEGGD